MNGPKREPAEYNRKALGFGIAALYAMARTMAPDIGIESMMKKRGFRRHKTEADVERMAAAQVKRDRKRGISAAN
jgi:hypothetical protein